MVIEDDGRVAYAYLLENDDIVGDVWLYNRDTTPFVNDWQNAKSRMPFLNSYEFVKTDEIIPIVDSEDVDVRWFYLPDKVEPDKVDIFLRDKLVARLKPGYKPGWSSYVTKDGPLAKKL